MSTNSVNIKVGLDGSEFNKGIKATIAEFNALKSTVNQNKIAWQESNQELKKFAQEFNAAKTQTQGMKDKLATLKTTVESNKIAYGDAKLSLDKYKQGMGNITPAVNNLKGSVSKLGGALSTLGAGFSLYAVANEVKMAGIAYEEQLKTLNLFHSALKATGYASGETAEELEVMAQRYSSLTGIQDENVAAAEDMLLTFRNIGKDIFPQATQATLNMAVAMNHGLAPDADMLTKTAIRLGKALNDPILGMTALRRVGVMFTEQQQEMVKQMVRSGNGLEAQKYILKELEREFGGAAQAAATMGDKANVAFDQMQQALGHFEESGAGKEILNWWIEQENHVTNLINKIRLYSSSINELSIQDAKDKLSLLDASEKKYINKFSLNKAGARDVYDSHYANERDALAKRIIELRNQQKAEESKAKGNNGENDFNKGSVTKKGKSYDAILNEQASLLKAQSDLEIASNDYTDAQILKKKIELQEKLIALDKSTTTKGKTEQTQAQAELLTLQKQYNQQVVNDKLKALEQASSENKIYAQMDAMDKLNNMSLTEKQIQSIKNQSDLEQLQSEIRTQQQILIYKSYGVDDISKLSEKEKDEYDKALLDKLQSEEKYQEKLGAIRDQERQKNKQMADSIAGTLSDGLKSAIDGTKTMSEAFADMLETMAADLMTSALKKQLENLFNLNSQINTTSTGFSSGGGFWSAALSTVGSLFGGGFADGGQPPVGVPSIVGENGPELFIPSTAGTIIPNHVLAQSTLANPVNQIQQQQQQQAPIIYAPQINTKAKKEDVMSALNESSREFFAYLGKGIQGNYGNIRPLLRGVK
ncbi:MAG: phage tail length tape measure family protein [Candidatus Gastranaerophilaceae bacterium]